MTDNPSHHPELRFLEGLVNQYAIVAGDVLAVDSNLWAIHGIVPRDGEIIMAEFDRPEAARSVLSDLKPNRIPSPHAASDPGLRRSLDGVIESVR